mmetsp:Transcript_63194/g.77349  ORF Transcript_63194/g.77349 Transcript_63194/m.77349 type:complete len:268 (-) Transcript_63194:95-898(-)
MMSLNSFPNGCMILSLVFLILGVLIDTLLVQQGTGNDIDGLSVSYYIIWKTKELIVVSAFSIVLDPDKYTTIDQGQTISTDEFINTYTYQEIYSKFCDNNNNNSSLNNITDDLDTNACNNLSRVGHGFNIAGYFYDTSLTILSFIIILWLICVIYDHYKHLSYNRSKCIVKTIKILGVINIFVCVVTLLTQLVSISINKATKIVEQVIITDFEYQYIRIGPSIMMLGISCGLVIITLYVAFYSKVPDLAFVDWKSRRRADSDDSVDV